MFCLFDGMGYGARNLESHKTFGATSYAIIILTEVACLHDFIEEEFALFLVWSADEVGIGPGEDGLKDFLHLTQKLL